MKCKTNKCDEVAYALSMHDKPRRISKATGEVIDYNRTTNWKCPNSHINQTKSVITHAEKYPPSRPVKDTSAKRFHRKGFTGHVVNDYRYQRDSL